MTLEELEKMTVVKLREEAMKFPDVKGVSVLKKDQLIELLCEKLSIQKKKKPQAAPPDKQMMKKKLKELKGMKKEALERNDYHAAILCRKKIRTYKRRLRKMLKASAPS